MDLGETRCRVPIRNFPPLFFLNPHRQNGACAVRQEKKAHSCSRAFVIFLRYVTLRDATNNTEGAQILKEKKNRFERNASAIK